MGVAIPQIITEDRASGALVVDGSLRFDSGKSNYLTRTPASAGNRKTWTWSGWVKRSTLGSTQRFFGDFESGGSNGADIEFTSSDGIRILDYASSTQWELITTSVYRDPSAWYHILVALDTTQGTSSDRLKLYVNGIQVTTFGTSTYPGSSVNGGINLAQAHGIGRAGAYTADYFNGYLANIHFIDGQALTPSYFGYTDALTNTWRPKKLSSSVAFGTNGFYLPFDGSAPIGQDQSGRGNNWTPVNFGGSNTLEKATGALPILNTDGGGKVARVGVRTDSSASSLVLALPLVGIKSDFSNAVNSGTSNKAITANGNAAASSSYSNFYGGSFYFDGTGDWLSIGTSSDFSIGTSDNFTFEAFIYPTSVSDTTPFGIGNNAGFAYRIISGSPYLYIGAVGGILNTGTISANKWTHITITRNNGTLYSFIDGVLVGSVANTSSFNGTQENYVGAANLTGAGSPGYTFTGYIQDVRFYKGLAKYTQNFIPASTDPDILPDTPSGVSYTSNLTQITDGAVAFDGSGDYLSLASSADFGFSTPSGNSNDFTIEWFKHWTTLSGYQTVWSNNYISSPGLLIQTGNGDGRYRVYVSSGTEIFQETNAPAVGSWYHYALVRNGTTYTLYRNGIANGAAGSSSAAGSGSDAATIGQGNGSYYENGFISNFHVVKGTALYTSNFTPPTAGISSVTNTKLLCCKSNSSATAFDVSPGTITANGNAAATNFNPFTANINTQRGKQSGYCTLNPLKKGAHITSVTNGNLQFESTGSTQYGQIWGTVAVNSGKWYWEGTEISGGGIAYGWGLESANSLTSEPGGDANTWVYLSSGYKYNSGSIVSYGFSSDDGDTIGVAFNADNGELSFYKNGIYMGVAYTLTTGRYYAPVTGDPNSSTNCSGATNFGQKPFKFPPPAGFQPLALANTPRPTIVRPDQYVGVSTYIGNGSTQSIGGLGFKPDFVWIKCRDASVYHALFDSVRGVNKRLGSNETSAEQDQSPSGLSQFLSNGFTVVDGATGGNGINGSPGGLYAGTNASYVAWTWKAGGNSNTFNINDVGYATASAAGLTAGTITPTGASVNTKSGFSIIGYTGTGSAGSISHGLGKAPSFIIIKKRTSSPGATNWRVYHSGIGNTKALFLSTTGAEDTNSVYWNNTSPTSSVFTLGTDDGLNASSQTHIAYLWAEIPGFSKFGSYAGNSSTDGPTIVTGFRPRWVMIKRINTTGSWEIYDTTRSSYNPAGPKDLQADTSGAENASTITNGIDFLSNGFKLRDTTDYLNTNVSSSTYLYAAFAETPTQNLYGAQSNAR